MNKIKNYELEAKREYNKAVETARKHLAFLKEHGQYLQKRAILLKMKGVNTEQMRCPYCKCHYDKELLPKQGNTQ